jgi:carotenoid 1,2-hydratase
VFSPYYARARRRDVPADPQSHCALNVALYAPGVQRWAMTERGAAQLQRDAATLRIGPSALEWRGDRLEITIDEITAPWPGRIRGRITLEALARPGQRFALDAGGQHVWSPLAPCARVVVALERPYWRWQGVAYLDANHGAVPLERDFRAWDWSRAALPGHRAAVLYDVARRDGSALSLGLRFDGRGDVEAVEPPPRVALPSTTWRLARTTRADAGKAACVLRRLEDGPFYARALIASRWHGEPVQAVHESLSLERFAARWVQMLLPFRMPRRAR